MSVPVETKMGLLESIFTYIVAPIVTVVGTWLAAKLKQKRDVKKAKETEQITERKSELENVEHAIKIWSGLADKLEKKLDTRDNEIHELKLQLNEISIQNRSLLKKVTHLEKQNTEMAEQNRLISEKYDELKKELSK